MEEKIIKVWFEKGQIYIRTTTGKDLSLPLELFPTLKEASHIRRESYAISKWGDALRWKELDVDIHISSFYEEIEIKSIAKSIQRKQSRLSLMPKLITCPSLGPDAL